MTIQGTFHANAYYNRAAGYGQHAADSGISTAVSRADAKNADSQNSLNINNFNTDSLSKDEQVKPGYRSSPANCKTCRERKYQDGSDEADVSFKSPGHISPQASAGTVMAHEKQHVSNAYQEAAKNDGKVLATNVTLRTAVCPECGTAYTAGGTTRTTIQYSNESNPYQQNQKAWDALLLTGANIDYAA